MSGTRKNTKVRSENIWYCFTFSSFYFHRTLSKVNLLISIGYFQLLNEVNLTKKILPVQSFTFTFTFTFTFLFLVILLIQYYQIYYYYRYYCCFVSTSKCSISVAGVSFPSMRKERNAEPVKITDSPSKKYRNWVAEKVAKSLKYTPAVVTDVTVQKT